MLPVKLAGGGTVAQILASIEDLEQLSLDQGYEFYTAWSEELNGILGQANWNINMDVETHPERYERMECEFDWIISDLQKRGQLERVVVYTFGYTAFAPNALQKYQNQSDFELVTIIGDCSTADTDILGQTTESRFLESAYNNVNHIVYSWAEDYPSDNRIPPNLAQLIPTAQPFGSEFLDRLRLFYELSREEARAHAWKVIRPVQEEYWNRFPVTGVVGVKQRVEGGGKDCPNNRSEFVFQKCDKRRSRSLIGDQRNLLIVLAASDLWDKSAVGSWMTEKQFNDVDFRSTCLIPSLNYVAKLLGRSITLIVNEGFSIPPFFRDEFIHFVPAKFNQDDYYHILKGADCVITRATHSVTSAECAAMGIPTWLFEMPRFGYMDVDVFTQYAVSQGLVHYTEKELYSSNDDFPDFLNMVIADVQSGTSEVAARAYEEFWHVNEQRNFFEAIKRFLI